MIKVNNWSRYQSYKDRRPPWIRFHRTILDDYKFQMMNSEARALLPMLWLLACENEDPISGIIEYTTEEISFRLRVEIFILESAISEIQLAGFIECIESVTKPLQKSTPPVTPETETKTETETESYSRIFDHWNSLKIITHREIKKFIPFINARLDKYSESEIIEAMNNYQKIINGEDYYWTHRWTLEDFLSRKKALDQFLTENDPFSNFTKDKNNSGIDSSHPYFERIQLLLKIISKKATSKEESDYSKGYNDISYNAMRQRASDEKERLIRD